jgi:hypothetical protein
MGSGVLELLHREGGEGNDDDEDEELLHAWQLRPGHGFRVQRVCGPPGRPRTTPERATGPIASPAEVSGHLVGSPAFKAGGTGDPRPAGSIPVHLRHIEFPGARRRSAARAATAADAFGHPGGGDGAVGVGAALHDHVLARL